MTENKVDLSDQAYKQTIQELAQDLAEERLKANSFLVALYEANQKIKALEEAKGEDK